MTAQLFERGGVGERCGHLLGDRRGARVQRRRAGGLRHKVAQPRRQLIPEQAGGDAARGFQRRTLEPGAQLVDCEYTGRVGRGQRGVGDVVIADERNRAIRDVDAA